MAEHESAAKKTNEKVDQNHRVRQQDARPLFDQSHAWDQGLLPLTETPFYPPMDEHAAILSSIPFSAQRHEFIMRLHQTYGNRYVQRLVESMGVQAKLTVSSPNDVYEQEADRVAGAVTRTINTPVQRQAEEEEEPVQVKASQIQCQEEEEEELQPKPLLQRQAEEEEEPVQMKASQIQCQEEEEEELQPKLLLQHQAEEEEEVQAQSAGSQPDKVSNSIEARIDNARGRGHPLSDNVRAPMEQAFRADFSNVRVHTGPEADTLNQKLSARAFTTGHDVFFRDGEYSPGSDSGRKVIAHELTHVVQQTGANKAQRQAPEEEEELVQMQPNEGNQATVYESSGNAPKIAQGVAQPVEGVVQRMVVAAADDIGKVTDPLVWNNLNWAISQAGGPIGDLTNNRVWIKGPPEEVKEVRIVGHGSEKGHLTAESDIGTTKAKEYYAEDIKDSMLQDRLNLPDRPRLKRIVFQSCHAGEKNPTSLVEEMGKELTKIGQKGVEVTGRTGIAFGFKGMGGATAKSSTGTYIFPKDSRTKKMIKKHLPYTASVISTWVQDPSKNFSDGLKAYFEAETIHIDYKTKSGENIFQTPFGFPPKYNEPQKLANRTEYQWKMLTPRVRASLVAKEMEDYWKDMKATMTALGGFKTDPNKAIKNITSK
ncbi:DUF4157 domain-containing protein [Chloroflexota bacterium]